MHSCLLSIFAGDLCYSVQGAKQVNRQLSSSERDPTGARGGCALHSYPRRYQTAINTFKSCDWEVNNSQVNTGPCCQEACTVLTVLLGRTVVASPYCLAASWAHRLSVFDWYDSDMSPSSSVSTERLEARQYCHSPWHYPHWQVPDTRVWVPGECLYCACVYVYCVCL